MRPLYHERRRYTLTLQLHFGLRFGLGPGAHAVLLLSGTTGPNVEFVHRQPLRDVGIPRLAKKL